MSLGTLCDISVVILHLFAHVCVVSLFFCYLCILTKLCHFQTINIKSLHTEALVQGATWPLPSRPSWFKGTAICSHVMFLLCKL